MPWVCLQFVIVVFPYQTHLLFMLYFVIFDAHIVCLEFRSKSYFFICNPLFDYGFVMSFEFFLA